MDFNNLRTSGSRYCGNHPAADYAIAGSAGGCAFLRDASLVPSSRSRDPLEEERLAERTRIAQELHDTLLQGILAASMQLHAAVDRLPADCSERQRISDVTQLVERAIDQGRCVLRGLRSPGVHLKSLGEAFARVPNDLGFEAPTGFRVVVLGKERQLRTAALDEVYRIGCEAIVNACRHSRARKIEAEVEYGRTDLRIVVRDNGCGIAPQDLGGGRKGHWGLRGMRERAERIGARLQLWSRVALGTEVELSVPGWVVFEGPAAA